MKPEMTDVANLVEDFDLYPRGSVDSTHVTHLIEAIESGVELPPVVADGKSRRIVDGVHRCRAMRSLYEEKAQIAVVWKEYATEAEMLLDAIRLNANHGRNLSAFDRTVAITKALKLEIDPTCIATALNMKTERVTKLVTQRVVKIEGSRTRATLKMPIRHMAGQVLSMTQAQVIPHLGGNTQMFYVNQLIRLIENNMLDTSNEVLLERLDRLAKLLMKLHKKAG